MKRTVYGVIRQTWRNYPSKRAKQNQIKRDETVLEFATKNTRRAKRVYGFGFTPTGALGVPSLVRPHYKNPIHILRHPIRLSFFPKNNLEVRAVACGYGFSIFVCKHSNGWKLYGCGLCTDSQIGLQDHAISGEISEDNFVELIESPRPISLPFRLTGNDEPLDVSCGRSHSVLHTTGGNLFSFGNNVFGQCGREIIEGEIFRKNAIVSKINIDYGRHDDKIKNVVCGQDHSLFLTKRGHVYSCGLGSDGQLGLGHFENIWQPTRVKGDIENKAITSIGSRGDTVLVSCQNGHIYGWGNSEYGQLCDDDIQLPLPRRLFPDLDLGHVIQVAAAGSMCAILNSEGHVYVWGYGKLGLGPKVSILSEPQKLPPPLFGANQLDPDCRVTHIASGLHHFVALNNRGTLFSWGSNRSGCLGLGQEEDQSFPLRISIPAEVVSMACGVDHMIVLSKAFA